MLSNIKAARMLGWTSLAVGLTEIFATHWLEEQLGVDDHHLLIRAYGVREIGAGAAILQQPGVSSGLAAELWNRVAGDALDLATLAVAGTTTKKPNGVAIITTIVLAITGLDILIASLIQHDVARAKVIAQAARQRVNPTTAIPSRPTNSAAAIDVPVSIGDA